MSFAQAQTIKMRDQPMLNSELLSIRPVLLHVLLANRNAWQATTSRIYDGAEGLFGTIEAAKAAAEDERKPGTWFRTMELPGLALRAEGGLVVMTEHHSVSPFGAWNLDRGSQRLVIGTPLRDALRALGVDGPWRRQISRDSFITGTIRDLFVSELWTDSFTEWRSQSHGSRYYLGWEDYRLDYVRDGVDAVRQAFVDLNGVEAVAEGERRYFAARDAEFSTRLGSEFSVPRPAWYEGRVA